MHRLREWIVRLWGSLAATRSDRDLEEELRLHVELAAASGRPAGSLTLATEAMRDQRGVRWLDELTRDVRLGFRGLGRDRLFAASVILILALGIGTSVTMFSVLNAVVLRPLPYARPDELARLDTYLIREGQVDGTSFGNFLDWRQQSRSFAAMTYYRRTSVSVVIFAGIEAPQRAQEGLVGPEFFDLVGTPPLIGRTFSREEFERGERVVVLSEGLWQEQYARLPGALGRTLSIDGLDHLVVGVMPKSFHLPTKNTRFWRPFSLSSLWPKIQSWRGGDNIEVLGRLAPGVQIDAARTETNVIAGHLREAHASNRNIDIRITPLLDHVVGGVTTRGMWLGFVAVLALLLIACANVAGLLSVRAARRRRELAVRSALGAGRARLVRQLLAESLSLWAVASVTGIVLASGSIRLLLSYGPRLIPRLEDTGLDITGVTVAFLGGLAVVIVAGTIPAFVAARTDNEPAFGARDHASLPRRRLQDSLVVAQIAGTVVLLIGAVLFAQSFLRAHNEDPATRRRICSSCASISREPGTPIVRRLQPSFAKRANASDGCRASWRLGASPTSSSVATPTNG